MPLLVLERAWRTGGRPTPAPHRVQLVPAACTERTAGAGGKPFGSDGSRQLFTNQGLAERIWHPSIKLSLVRPPGRRNGAVWKAESCPKEIQGLQSPHLPESPHLPDCVGRTGLSLSTPSGPHASGMAARAGALPACLALQPHGTVPTRRRPALTTFRCWAQGLWARATTAKAAIAAAAARLRCRSQCRLHLLAAGPKQRRQAMHTQQAGSCVKVSNCLALG